MTKVAKVKFWVQITLASAMLITAAVLAFRPAPALPYRDFVKLLEAGDIASLTLGDSPTMEGRTKEGASFVTENPRREGYKEYLLGLGIAVGEAGAQTWPTLLGVTLIGVVLLVGFSRQGKARGGMAKITSMEAEAVVPTITFEDVAANEEARASLRGLVDFIKEPAKYAAYGARIPHGVLLYGPPGTGKTLMARALAGEAGVPFYSVSGSDFVQVYVGVGASRIRDLFKKARKAERAVIFIDEIDALGKKRESSNDEREQTLNALLTEMSGFAASEGVVVVAATNRLDTLDEALLRPGRFDRQIEVGLPSKEERLRILRLHTRNKPIDQSIDLSDVAANTVYFSGAKLESMLNEAAIMAAQRGDGDITRKDIDQAIQTLLVGAEKSDRSGISAREKRVTAIHEAAHALVTVLKQPESRLAQVSIIPSTKGAAGYSMSIPPDRIFHTREQLEGHIAVALAGRAGEELIFGAEQVTTGASNDLQRATELVVSICFEWGMEQRIGPVARTALRDVLPLGKEEREIVREKSTALYQQTLALLSERREALLRIADALEIHEVLDGQAVRELIEAA